MSVYSYDLVPLRTKTRWTREMDEWLLAEYFPGLSFAAVADEAMRKFPRHWQGITERSIKNRLRDIRDGKRNGT